MQPVVELWDVDIMNSIRPVVKLGRRRQGRGALLSRGFGGSKSGGRRKRDNSAQGHSESVLSLSWNRQADHLLASGGADSLVVLWDLDEAKVA